MQNQKSFFQKNKKILIILFLAILSFSLLVYFLFFNQKTDTNGNKINNLPSFNFSFNNLFNSNNNTDLNDNLDNQNASSSEETEDYLEDYYFEGLIKVWNDPVAGYNYYTKPYKYTYQDETGKEITTTLTKTILQFVDSKTGHLYEKDLSEPTSTPYQVSVQSYPNIARAYFLNEEKGGKGRVFMQYLENNIIKTITATIPNYYGSPANLLNVANLPNNIKYITVSPDQTKLVYLIQKNKTINDYTDIYSDWYYISNLDQTYGSRVYTSDLAYFKLIVLNDGQIYAYNTDTSLEMGSLYKLNMNSSVSSLELIYGEHSGMFFQINDNNLLVSITTANNTQLYTKTFTGQAFTDNNLSKLSINTLANKCAQTKDLTICGVPKELSNYEYGLPDAWYQGMTTFDDNLYVVNSDYPQGQLLFDLKLDGDNTETIDAKNLQINDSQTHLAFLNKNDGSL